MLMLHLYGVRASAELYTSCNVYESFEVANVSDGSKPAPLHTRQSDAVPGNCLVFDASYAHPENVARWVIYAKK